MDTIDALSLRIRGMALLLMIGLAGCGGSGGPEIGPTGTVSGTVTFKGDAVKQGKVQFYAMETGKSGLAELDQSGAFKMTEALPVGQYKVSVLPPDEEPPTSPTPVAMTEHANIPEKYRTELTTDLTAEVKEGDNKFPFDLQ